VTGGKDKSSFVPLYDIFQHFCEKQQLLYNKDECLEVEFVNPKIDGVLRLPFPKNKGIRNVNFSDLSFAHFFDEKLKNIVSSSTTTTSKKSQQQNQKQKQKIQSVSSDSLSAQKSILKSSSRDSLPKLDKK
jgi:hypothetical protein